MLTTRVGHTPAMRVCSRVRRLTNKTDPVRTSCGMVDRTAFVLDDVKGPLVYTCVLPVCSTVVNNLGRNAYTHKQSDALGLYKQITIPKLY